MTIIPPRLVRLLSSPARACVKGVKVVQWFKVNITVRLLFLSSILLKELNAVAENSLKNILFSCAIQTHPAPVTFPPRLLPSTWSALKPAAALAPAAGTVPAFPSWGQQRARRRCTGRCRSRCWCSWSRGRRRTSARSRRTARRWRSSSRTSLFVENLWERNESLTMQVTVSRNTKVYMTVVNACVSFSKKKRSCFVLFFKATTLEYILWHKCLKGSFFFCLLFWQKMFWWGWK